MIKKLKKYQIKLTPFDATKEWELSTSNNQDLLLMDDPSVPGEEPVALEYIDYGSINQFEPVDNFECNIALEQQPDDLATVQRGLNVSGFFYPELDPTNQDGTFKRVIWHQINTMFYNQYKDPTKIWGATNIDFDLSQTKRKISDGFKLYGIPTDVFGNTIVPFSITFEDTSLDDNFTITDDGNANLFAGSNLFSTKDELGNHPNIFIVGSNDTCNQYFDVVPVPFLSLAQGNSTNSLSWTINPTSSLTGFDLQRSAGSINDFKTLVILPSSSFNYDDFPVSDNTTIYYYRISAFTLLHTSSFSNIVENTLTIIS